MALQYAVPTSETYQYPLILRNLLSNTLATSANQEIVYRDKFSYTYADFVIRVGKLASVLAAFGVTSGATVAVMDWDSHRYLESYFAVPMMGAVLQTVNIRMSAAQIAYTLQETRAETVIVHNDFLPVLASIRDELPSLKTVIGIRDGQNVDFPDWIVGEYEDLSAAASPDYPFEDFDENALATTFFTTGTTGNPKGVSFSHRQLVLHALVACGPFGSPQSAPVFGYGDVYMPLTPMFHVHAWGIPYVATMLGVKQVYPGRYEPPMICRLREEHNVTYSHCVPTVLQMVLDAAEQTGANLNGWKMGIGGSALSKSLCQLARSRGVMVQSGYGMSETGPTIAMTRPFRGRPEDEEEDFDIWTASGVPVPLVQARIVDEQMRDLPHDGKSRGELVLRAPWLTVGYARNEEASKELWRGGWMHTQDVATMDEHGYIRIRDRLKDVIKTGGEWIDSIQLEDLVGSAPGVAQVGVIGMPHARWGERPFAVIVPQPGAELTLADLNAPIEQAVAEGKVSRYALLDGFWNLDSLPKTSVGKIDKKALRALLAEQADDGIAKDA